MLDVTIQDKDAPIVPFVEFQKMFDEASKLAAPEHWAYDGVHPTWAGAALMAHTWRQAVGA